MSANIPPAPFFLTSDVAERHRLYAELSRSGPVHRVVLPHGEPAWLVVRFEQARAALTDPRLVKMEPPFAAELDPGLRSAINSNMLNVDLVEHARLRRLVASAFTRGRVERLAPRIQQVTDELLDPLAARPDFDLIAEFAYPLPVAVICELLGVPESGRESFRKWSWADVNATVIGLEAYTEAVSEFVEYLRELIAHKRAQPGDDLVSALIAARDGSDQLSEDELTSMIYLLLVAGHETTVNLIANGVFVLLNRHGAWALLGSEPERVPQAVEELLRINGPVQTSTLRTARESFEFAGVKIAKGDTVLVGLLAANRDVTDRPDAEDLDLTRAPNQHIAFGHGIHHCLGAPLGRLEAQTAFTSLLARFPDLRLAAAPHEIAAEPGLLINALQRLPVTTRPT